MGESAHAVIDDLGRDVTLAVPPKRVVCLVPSLTELLFTLGCGPRVVGVTRYCVEPAAAVAGIAKVGGTKNPDLESIYRLQPDLVVVCAEENRRKDAEAMFAAGLNVFVSFVRRVDEVPSLIERLGRLTGCEAAAGRLAGELNGLLAGFPAVATRRRFFCPIWKQPWMTFSADTYAGNLLTAAGGLNVCEHLPDRYPTVDLAAIAAADPEVILLPDEPYAFGHADLESLHQLAGTRAWQEQRVHFVDGKALAWYGPRSAAAVGYFRAILG